jgi:hypothetical protein
MILPMMAFLFALIAIGSVAGLALSAIPQSRRFAGFALVPFLAGVTSLCASWGLAVGLEAAFSSDNAGGIGFFGGYMLGGLSGAALGWVAAVRIKRRHQLTSAWSGPA